MMRFCTCVGVTVVCLALFAVTLKPALAGQPPAPANPFDEPAQRLYAKTMVAYQKLISAYQSGAISPHAYIVSYFAYLRVFFRYQIVLELRAGWERRHRPPPPPLPPLPPVDPTPVEPQLTTKEVVVRRESPAGPNPPGLIEWGALDSGGSRSLELRGSSCLRFTLTRNGSVGTRWDWRLEGQASAVEVKEATIDRGPVRPGSDSKVQFSVQARATGKVTFVAQYFTRLGDGKTPQKTLSIALDVIRDPDPESYFAKETSSRGVAEDYWVTEETAAIVKPYVGKTVRLTGYFSPGVIEGLAPMVKAVSVQLEETAVEVSGEQTSTVAGDSAGVP
ncbi:MAG: hypothetical protein HY815_06140 [Candidatus Riflebacteria bacterium]|nr:hypothetical protein [Candidatus Riflebacteria bacterium]